MSLITGGLMIRCTTARSLVGVGYQRGDRGTWWLLLFYGARNYCKSGLNGHHEGPWRYLACLNREHAAVPTRPFPTPGRLIHKDASAAVLTTPASSFLPARSASISYTTYTEGCPPPAAYRHDQAATGYTIILSMSAPL